MKSQKRWFPHNKGGWVSPEKWSNFNEKNRRRGRPPKMSPVSTRKIEFNSAHKPHDFWQIRPTEGMLVRCADATHCNHFAIFPAIPSHPPGT